MGGIFAALSLSPTERLAAEFIPGLLNQGLSANGVLSQLSQTGMGIRRARGLSLIRYFKGVQISSNYVKSVRNEYYPNPNRLSYSKGPLTENYHYIIRVNGTNVDTGEKSTKYVTVTSDTLITKAQAQGTAEEIVATNLSRYGTTVTGSVTDNILKNIAMAGVV